jgi:hypothetical protein
MPEPLPDLSKDRQCYHYQAPTGVRCGSPAMKHEYYCYFHNSKRLHRLSQKVMIDPEVTRMEIPAIEDRASVFNALAAVIHRLAENTIDTRRAGQMLYGLEICLRALEPARVPAAKSAPAPDADPPAQTQPATCNSQPATSGDSQHAPPKTVQITKEGLLYFLRSRHCAHCSAELFPPHELTERRHPGAPAEIIEEARPALASPQQIVEMLTGTLPRLQAVAEPSQKKDPHPGLRDVGMRMEELRRRIPKKVGVCLDQLPDASAHREPKHRNAGQPQRQRPRLRCLGHDKLRARILERSANIYEGRQLRVARAHACPGEVPQQLVRSLRAHEGEPIQHSAREQRRRRSRPLNPIAPVGQLARPAARRTHAARRRRHEARAGNPTEPEGSDVRRTRISQPDGVVVHPGGSLKSRKDRRCSNSSRMRGGGYASHKRK